MRPGRILLYLALFTGALHANAQITLRAKDSSALQNKIAAWIKEQHTAGKLEAGVIRIQQGVRWQATLFEGPVYRVDSLEVVMDSTLGFLWPNYILHHFSGRKYWQQLHRQNEENLQQILSAGYPFAHIDLKIIDPLQGHCHLLIHGSANRKIDWDTIIFPRGAVFDPYWLGRVLHIENGTPWSPIDMVSLRSRMNALGKVSWQGEPQVMFTSEKATLFIPATQREANQAMLLAGFNSDPLTSRLQLTGEARLHLENQARKGRIIHAEWRSFRGASQDLLLRTRIPYPFFMPISTEFSFAASRLDSTFTTITPQLNVDWAWLRYSRLSVGYELQNNIQQYTDTQLIKSTRSLPQNLGSRLSFFTMQFRYNRLDRPENPAKGIWAEISGSAGQRTLKRDVRIEQLRWPGSALGIYDSLAMQGALKSNPFRIRIQGLAAIPLHGKFTGIVQWKGQWLSDRNLGIGQAERLGGFNSLRGFNEQRIFATSYQILNLELRYRTGEWTHAGIFWNGALTELNAAGMAPTRDWFNGAGFSISFDTAPGILQMIWAMGNTPGQTLRLNDAKLHIGLISQF
jgi:hypothetical protein